MSMTSRSRTASRTLVKIIRSQTLSLKTWLSESLGSLGRNTICLPIHILPLPLPCFLLVGMYSSILLTSGLACDLTWHQNVSDICHIQAKALNVLAWTDSVSTNPWSSILSYKYLMPLDNGCSLSWYWRGKIRGAKQSRGSQITLGSPHMVTAYLIPL